MNNKLLFLYPIRDYMEEFDLKTIKLLNETIDTRYRSKGYQIYYATFPDIKEVVLSLQQDDKVIKTDTTYWVLAYRFRYPTPYKLIRQLDNVDNLVICGFHLPDCIQKIAKESIKRKINTLIDMDLCEFFPLISNDSLFDINDYNENNTIRILKNSLDVKPEYKEFINNLQDNQKVLTLKR